jgi:ribosomal protein S18 acetylase RimI-like enzyme
MIEEAKSEDKKLILNLFQKNITLYKNKKISDHLIKLILNSYMYSKICVIRKDKKIISAIMLIDSNSKQSIFNQIRYSFLFIFHPVLTFQLTYLNYKKPRYDNKYIEIIFLSTKIEYQHQGFAEKLLKYTIDYSRKNNFDSIITQTVNPLAFRLYTKNNFVVDYFYKTREYDYYFLRLKC